jgi:hypothetical protein
MSAAIRVGLMVIAPILVASSVSAPSRPSSVCRAASNVVTVFHDVAAVAANNVNDAEEEDAKGSPDLYGNEVRDAVTKYKLDDTGSLYEVHSPQTELPRLASPTS